MAKCRTYCPHGGICVLDAGHEGLHSSDYCTWNDAESLSNEEADRLIIEKDPVAGPMVTMMSNFASDVFELSEDEDQTEQCPKCGSPHDPYDPCFPEG